MSKGSTTQKTSQTNNPPAWAAPLLQQAAGDAMKMYQSGQGYNVYRGPTVAEYSPEKLAGLNKALTMTGYTGAPVSNEAMFGTDQIKQVQAMINKQIADEKARKAAAAAAAAAAAVKKTTPYKRQDPYVGARGGDRTSSGQGYAGGGPGGSYGFGGSTGSAQGGAGKGSSAWGGKGGLY